MRFSSSSVAMPSSPGHHDVDDRRIERHRARQLEAFVRRIDASRTVYPSRVSSVSRISRMISSSSTTRTMPVPDVAIIVPV